MYCAQTWCWEFVGDGVNRFKYDHRSIDGVLHRAASSTRGSLSVEFHSSQAATLAGSLHPGTLPLLAWTIGLAVTGMCYYRDIQYVGCGHWGERRVTEFCAAAAHSTGAYYPCRYAQSDGPWRVGGNCPECEFQATRSQWWIQLGPLGRSRFNGRPYQRANGRRRSGPLWMHGAVHAGAYLWDDCNPGADLDEQWTGYRKPGHLGAAMDYEPRLPYIKRL